MSISHHDALRQVAILAAVKERLRAAVFSNNDGKALFASQLMELIEAMGEPT